MMPETRVACNRSGFRTVERGALVLACVDARPSAKVGGMQVFKTVFLLTSLLAFPLVAQAKGQASANHIGHGTRSWHGSLVHFIEVPAGMRVYPVAAPKGLTLEAFVQHDHALAGINGGYFNHSDGWPVSHVQVGGRAVTDPEHNQALCKNPVLLPLLPRILAHRAEWRHVTSNQGDRWQIAFHDEPTLAGETVVDALQAGPRLLPTFDPVDEAFVVRDQHGKVVRDGIASTSRATRSALGLRANGVLLLVGVGAPGLSLLELKSLLLSLGAASALNLDGGSSTGLLWPEGKKFATFHGGHATARLNSVLLVGP
jgi:hypothetical protein